MMSRTERATINMADGYTRMLNGRRNGVVVTQSGPGIENAYGGIDSPKLLRAFSDYTIDMMRTGLFDFIAHPDLFGVSYGTWNEETVACSRDILQASVDLGIGMEINALGLRRAGIDAETRRHLQEAYHTLYRSNLTPAQAAESLAQDPTPEVQHLAEFVSV